MGILSANNSTSYTANNNCKIYIIKQIDPYNQEDFESYYADLLSNSNKSFLNKVGQWVDNVNVLNNNKVKLTPLMFNNINSKNYNELKYTEIKINKNEESNVYDKDTGEIIPFDGIWFLTDLLELRNCPLIDFTKLAYVFQIDGQSKAGIPNVTSFNCSFSVNGQSSCDINLNNQDYKFNFKYFNDRENYLRHLKCYFETNDIIIVRMEKKNTTPTSLLNSFKKSSITSYQDIYKSKENDPFTTVFTGYINDINESFSYENGTQNLEIHCTGPSKKLTWTRILQNNAVASKDSGAAIMPISAYVTGVQTSGATGKHTIKNKQIVKNLITRTYSGINNIPKIKKTISDFNKYFEINIHASAEEKRKVEENLKAKIENEKEKSKTSLNSKLNELKKQYYDLVSQNFDKFVKETKNEIQITCNSFIAEDNGWSQRPLFEIQGTDQPAYRVQFEQFNEIFQANFSTAYQFIKGIADKLMFNFYDDPYGIIHFSVPDMTLQHLYRNDTSSEVGTDPNVLTQITSFSQSQNTESIANIQCSKASYFYDLPMDMINDCVKDYDSIAKYGERMMQVLEITGITNPKALRYASKQMMNKYNRKALANIKVQMQGEPGLKMDKYAYIKDLRKLFYVESYSHSYQAGGNFTTSLNGTYLRKILALSNMVSEISPKLPELKGLDESGNYITQNNNLKDVSLYNFNKQLSLCNTYEENIKKLNEGLDFKFTLESLQQQIYNIYINIFGYPENLTELQQELNGIYNSEETIKSCYLDGFFWELPFDIDPYKEAERIQNEEKSKIKVVNATKTVKRNVQKNKSTDTVNSIKSLSYTDKSQGKLDKSYVDTNIEIKPETIFSTTTTRGTTPLYKSKPYYVDVNAKTLDWMELLETASKIKGPQLKRG